MAETVDSRARTRAFARVMGPFFAIVPATVALRPGQIEALLGGFFDNPAFTWIVGAILLFGGLLIIARHQIWRGAPAIVISLLGWLLALRGIILLAAPELLERAASAAMGITGLITTGFGLFAAIGLWLTYVGWIAKAPGDPSSARA